MSFYIGNGKVRLCIGHLPGHKYPSLYKWENADVEMLASFKSFEAGDFLQEFLVGLANQTTEAELTEVPPQEHTEPDDTTL